MPGDQRQLKIKEKGRCWPNSIKCKILKRIKCLWESHNWFVNSTLSKLIWSKSTSSFNSLKLEICFSDFEEEDDDDDYFWKRERDDNLYCPPSRGDWEVSFTTTTKPPPPPATTTTTRPVAPITAAVTTSYRLTAWSETRYSGNPYQYLNRTDDQNNIISK